MWTNKGVDLKEVTSWHMSFILKAESLPVSRGCFRLARFSWDLQRTTGCFPPPCSYSFLLPRWSTMRLSGSEGPQGPFSGTLPLCVRSKNWGGGLWRHRRVDGHVNGSCCGQVTQIQDQVYTQISCWLLLSLQNSDPGIQTPADPTSDSQHAFCQALLTRSSSVQARLSSKSCFRPR